MEKSMKHDASPIRKALGETLPLLKTYSGEEKAEELRAFIEKRLAEGKPTVMVYGIYNSGKSTLLNAFLGRELAPVANRPETNRVTPYEWEGFEILDTPGIDAPQDHEAVTREQLEKTDVIVFVMDSSSTFEEKKIYDEIVDIMARNKRLMIVVNNKSGLSTTDGRRFGIDDKILENLRAALAQKGLDPDGEGAIPPIRPVDAKTGLRGRMENEPALVEVSGLSDLERDLKIELGKAGFHDVVNTVGERLLDALKDAIARATPEESRDGPAERLADDETKIDTEKIRVESALARARHDAVGQFRRQAAEALDSCRPEDVAQAFRDSCDPVEQAIGRELEAARRKIPDLAAAYGESAGRFDAEARRIAGDAPPDSDGEKADSGVDIRPVVVAAQPLLAQFAKTLGRFGPYVAPAMGVLTALWEFFSERSERERTGETMQRQARHWANYVAESAERLNDALAEAIGRSIDEAFGEAEAAVRARKNELDDRGREMARHREILSVCRERVRRHLEYMRGAE